MKTYSRMALATCTLVASFTFASSRALTGQEGEGFSFDKYHTVGEFEAYLATVAHTYPSLTTLLEIGRSREGRPIMALEINNPETGPANEKPGFYVDGNIHGGEVLGGEAALYFIDGLMRRYGQEGAITELVDGVAFYVVPLVNPDGRAISVDTPENHRWNVRPVDEDEDGLEDEDPPEDVDGDGRLLQMRVPDPAGRWKISQEDPRRMVRRARGEEGGRYYQLYSEGLDNDGDGRYNEDRVGGVDLNRNFPANWSAAQFASGPYPLSEPETHALVEYITSRPSIAAVHTFHTSGGLLLRFPTLADQDWEFPQADLDDYNEIAAAGVEITGYEHYAYEKKAIVDLMAPGHGVFNDWASKEFGVLAMTTELWGHPMGGGSAALYEWNDNVLGGSGFVAWHPFRHPVLGQIELGGWDRWSVSNPPEHMIAEELERNFRWVLSFAERMPRVAILDMVRVESAPDQHEVTVSVANVGWMATATVHAQEVLGIAKPVTVSISLDNLELMEGQDGVISLGTLPGSRAAGPVAKQVSWSLRVLDSSRPAAAQITVWSQKAGVVREQFRVAAKASGGPP